MSTQIYGMTWQGIAIELTYAPDKWQGAAHLEVRSITPERVLLESRI